MLTLAVYDKNFIRQGWVGAPVTLTVTLAHNAPGGADFSVDADHSMVEHLLADGARVVISYGDDRIFSGRIVNASGSGPDLAGFINFVAEDDWALLEQMLGWPRPTSSIGNQGDDGTHWRFTGPVETALKNLVQVNATRLGLPVTVEPSLGRGPSRANAVRFRTPAEAIVPALDAAGLGVRVLQQDDRLVVSVYEPDTWPLVLDEASGIVAEWSWSKDAPSATRVVVGAGGEGQERHFAQMIDTAREAQFGSRLEVFRDARDVAVDDEDRDTILAQRMTETLDETGPRAGLRVAFTENEGFQYARAYNLGDTVTIEVGKAGQVTDRLREITLTWQSPEHVAVSSNIGERIDSFETPDVTILQAIRSLYRRMLRLETSN